MKKPTKKQQKEGLFRAYKKAIGENPGAKDGSIATHSIVPVDETKTEAEVLSDCLSWLKGHRIVANRHDCGSGNFGHGYATYGIKHAGDIIGLLRSGRHFEIETKCGKGGRLSAGQQKRMKKIRENNGLYYVVHGKAELECYLEDKV